MQVVIQFVLGSARNIMGWTVAIVVSALLLTIMPMVQYMGMHGLVVPEKQTFQVAPLSQTMSEKKKAKPRENKTKPLAQKSAQGPKSMARSTLSMDLGVGGGTGGVAIGSGGSGGDGQMVYAEGETDEDAMPLRQVAPHYPEEARKAGVSGLVRVLITIQEDGTVGDIRFLETPGDYGFESVVREALAQWRFQPAQMGGIPVKQKMEQPFQF